MKVEIVLKNPRYCDDCPCQNSDLEDGASCNLGYYEVGQNDYRENAIGEWHSFRAQKCIDEHGE